VGTAAIVQTTQSEQFLAIRQGLSTFLVNPYGFWLFVFVLLFIIATSCLSVLRAIRHPVIPNPILSKDGVLLFDREEHIAFSVRTLKSLLIRLSDQLPEGHARETLLASGEAAGRRFGANFEQIYTERIEADHIKPWSKLTENEKLDAWERYDATAGWGRIAAHQFNARKQIDIVISHPTLFEGGGGELFTWLLVGYCKEVATAILQRRLILRDNDKIIFDEGIVSITFDLGEKLR
jgi:hypothetical protein